MLLWRVVVCVAGSKDRFWVCVTEWSGTRLGAGYFLFSSYVNSP